MQLQLHYDFAGQGTLASRNNQGPVLTCDRLSEGPTRDASGWLRTVQADTGRFEGSIWSENINLESEDATVYNLTAVTVDANQTTAPNGELTADAVFETAATGAHNIYRIGSYYRKGHTYLMRWRIKANGRRYVNMQFGGTASPLNVTIEVDLETGAIGDVGVNAKDYGVRHDGDGWYSVWLVGQADATGSAYPLISLFEDEWTTSSYAGDITKGIYVWGLTVTDITGAWVSMNAMSPSENLNAWTVRGTAVITGGQPDPFGTNRAELVEGIQSAGNGDVFRSFVSTYGDNTKLIPSVWIKRISTSGTLNLGHPVNGSIGAWYIDFALLPDEWVRITRDHAAVTVVNEWRTSDVAQVGMFYFRQTGGSPLSFYAFGHQVEIAKPNQELPGLYVSNPSSNFNVIVNYPVPNYLETGADPVTFHSGPCVGIWVEEEKTNILVQSENFGTTWVPSAAIVETDQALAPDGSITADRIKDNNDAGSGAVAVSQNVTVANSTAYAASVFAKADQKTWMAIGANLFTTPPLTLMYFDLANGVAGTLPGDFLDGGIEDWGNGWYRCWVAFITDAVDTTGQLLFYAADADGDNVILRNDTASILLWGGDMEIGRSPTTYKFTDTVSATRNADDVQTTDTAWLAEESTQTWYLSAISPYVDDATGHHRYMTLSDGSASDQVVISRFNRQAGAASAATAGNLGGITLNGAVTDDTEIRMACAWNTNDMRLYVDGVDAGQDTLVDLPLASSITSLNIGRYYNASQYQNGIIKEIRCYDSRIIDEQLRKMTLSGSAQIFPGYDKKKQAKQKAIDAAIWNKAMNARTREARSESEEDYVPYNNIG